MHGDKTESWGYPGTTGERHSRNWDGKNVPSSHAVLTVVRKNWLPLVSLPALAIERTPGPVWVSVKFSSANFSP